MSCACTYIAFLGILAALSASPPLLARLFNGDFASETFLGMDRTSFKTLLQVMSLRPHVWWSWDELVVAVVVYELEFATPTTFSATARELK
jgi:hypothetical protein